MADDAHGPLGPFCCPAQECRDGDQRAPDFGDATDLYEHWTSAHQPRCPRTKCKYGRQGLKKTAQFDFLRHWSTHFPELNTSRSTCERCGREFPNASNRKRHAADCNGTTADANQTTTEATAREQEPDLSANLTEPVDADQTITEAPALELEPDLSANLTEPVDANRTITEAPALEREPDLLANPTEPLASTPEWLNFVSSISNGAWLPPSEVQMSFSPWLDVSSLEQAFANPALSSQPANPTADLWNNHTNFGQIPASTPQQCPFPGLAVDQSVMEHAENANMPSSSRKRGIDEATHPSKRHQSIMNGVGNQSESLSRADPYTETAGLSGVLLAGVSGRTGFGESNVVSESMIPESQVRAPTNAVVANGVDALTTSAASMTTLPRLLRQYDVLHSCFHSAQPSKSKRTEVHKQIAAVKTFVRSTSCLQPSSHDRHTWIREIKQGRRKITDKTTVLVNDMLISKKTRYPRIIDDDSPIFKFCATGNYDEVNRLLSLGQVTIVDVDSRGRTLLHWAAAHWQLSICQLLLTKGADVEVRDWGNSFKPATALGIACRTLAYDGHRNAIRNFKPKYAADTLRLLLESGLDIQASVEIDGVLISLGDNVNSTIASHSIKRAVAQQLSLLIRKYVQATKCDGRLSLNKLHPATHSGIRQSRICYTDANDEFWDEERPGCELLASMDTQFFQSFWIYMIVSATEYGSMSPHFSPQFCRSFTGDFHYQQPSELDGQTDEQSPMQLALHSFAALHAFHSILMACGTDIVSFAEKECTMTWCKDTQETLMNFFSLPLEQYEDFETLFSASCICLRCYKRYQYEGILDWDDIIELVRSGKTLASSLQSPSEEEKYMLRVSMLYCEYCRDVFYASFESDESEDDEADDSDEYAGHVEDEVEVDEDPVNDMRVSGMGYERMEGGTDASSSDGSSSDEDL